MFNMDAANRASTIPSTSTLKTFNTVNLSQSGSIVTDATWEDTTVIPSFNFDGTDGYIGTNISLNTLGISTTFSLSCWVNITTLNIYDTVIMGPTSEGVWNSGFGLMIYNSKLRFWVQNWAQANKFVDTATLNTDQWYHIVGTADTSNGLKMYVNSGIVDTSTTANIDGLTNSIYIGAAGPGNAYNFIGSISPLHIYNRALSSQEVKQNYNALKKRFE